MKIQFLNMEISNVETKENINPVSQLDSQKQEQQSSHQESSPLEQQIFNTINSSPTKDITLFNEALQSFLSLQKEIAEIEGEVRIRKSKLKELSATLMSYIKLHNIRDIKLEGEYRGTTLIPVYNKTVSFDKATIISTLQEYFADNLDEFERIMAAISENANVRESSKLSMKKPRKLTSKSRYDDELEKVGNLLGDDDITSRFGGGGSAGGGSA